MSTPAAPRRSIVSFTDRGGRMTPGQQRAWTRLWGRYGAAAGGFDGPAPPCRDGRLDPIAWFGRTAPLRLEIGSGMGETTAALAAAEPDTDHVAVADFCANLKNVSKMLHFRAN